MNDISMQDPPKPNNPNNNASKASQQAASPASPENALAAAGSDAPAFIKLERLQESGSVNVSDIAKLKAAGFATTAAVLGAMRKDLLAVKGIAEAKLDKIVAACQEAGYGASAWTTCADVAIRHEKQRFRISTGASALDAILKGGIEAGILTELYGEHRTGKTQLCHALCVQAQLHENFPGKVLYLDTCNTFRPDRIAEICAAHGLEQSAPEVMANILVARPLNSEMLLRNLVEAASALLVDEEQPFSLIIIDSLMGLFRQDFSGRGELAERQQRLLQCLSRLQKMAEEFNVAVVYTNVVMADPSGGGPLAAMFANVPKAAGGYVLSHASTCRLYMKKGKNNERIVKIEDSPNLPPGDATVVLDACGVKNADG